MVVHLSGELHQTTKHLISDLEKASTPDVEDFAYMQQAISDFGALEDGILARLSNDE